MMVAHRLAPQQTRAVHAVSAAVPPQATRRCERLASRFGWSLQIIDAGEFNDQRYMANPVDRCYYCKTNLFDSVLAGLQRRAGRVATGTNADDLSDFRPGLRAAQEHAVWQPFVEAEIDKSMIRAIARHLGLRDLAQLPAQPCLSSRIESGIPINPRDLQFVNHVERLLNRLCGNGDNRCRVTAAGMMIQLPADNMVFQSTDAMTRLRGYLQRVCDREQRILGGIEPYRRGSAFLQDGVARHTIQVRRA
jgi:uncharacterized protein